MTCETETEYTWRLVAGDDAQRTFAYKQPDETPVDLTGYTAELLYDVGPVSGNIAGVIANPTDGKVSVTIEDTLTTLFRGNGTFRLRITSGGGIRTTLVTGKLLVTQ